MSSKKAASVKVEAAAKPTPSPVDTKQLKSALLALYSHLSRVSAEASSQQLLEEEEDILLVVAMKKTPLKQYNMPIQIKIPHSLYDPASNPGTEICLFTKDPPQPADYDPKLGQPLENPIKTKLQQKPVAGITKVLPISKLRKNYKQFGDRRKLLSSYNLFLSDSRIIPLLPALLGVKFYEKKKQPVAVNLNQHDLTKELTKARDSTYMFVNTGPCSTIRISRSSFSRQQTFENITAALDQIAQHVPKKWAGVQSIHVKTQNSIALPVYNSGSSIDQLLEDPEPEPKKKKQQQSQKKGKKRALSQSKEDKEEAASQKKKQKTEAAAKKKAASDKKKAAAAPAPAAPTATPSKSTKRPRSESPAPATPAPSAAPSAKKAKKAAATPAPAPSSPAPATPAKAASTKKTAAASQSAKKAAATPKPKAATKKAPATAVKAGKK